MVLVCVGMVLEWCWYCLGKVLIFIQYGVGQHFAWFIILIWFGIVLVSFWYVFYVVLVNSGMIVVRFWYGFGVVLVWRWYSFGMILVYF